MFPLLDLPAVAVDLVHASVEAEEDKKALRLVSRRSRALVDRGVVALAYPRPPEALLEMLHTLVGAPWHNLQSLDLSRSRGEVGSTGAALLASAVGRWPLLQKLNLDSAQLGPAGAAALATAEWQNLRELNIASNGDGVFWGSPRRDMCAQPAGSDG